MKKLIPVTVEHIMGVCGVGIPLGGRGWERRAQDPTYIYIYHPIPVTVGTFEIAKC